MVKELVERIRRKDQRAMSQFYQQYVGELSSVCYRYVPSEDDAKDVLHKMISELSVGYRTVINLYVFEGYSHKQIADLLGITESTSASQLYFAKRILARRIKELTNSKR